MFKHVFYSILEGDWRAGAPDASPFHLNDDDARLFIELYERNVSAVFLDERAHSCWDYFFNHLQSLTVTGIYLSILVFFL